MDNQAQIPDLAHLRQLAESATQGEWQVIETELPCRIGRPHVERRIFTMKDHPQLKGPYPIVNGSVALGTDDSPVHHMVSITAPDAAFIAAASPAAVLALLVHIEALRGLYLMHQQTETREMRRLRNENDSLRAQLSVEK